MKKDQVTHLLENLSGGQPKPRTGLSEAEKDLLVQTLGKRTVQDILKTKKALPLTRIPFLFSSLDTQMVVDVLANDMSEALKRIQ